MIVDDEQWIARLVEALIRWDELEMSLQGTFYDGMEAFQHIISEKPDIVISDIKMPMMDGLQATVNIRHWSRSDAGKIPIIAMTANAFDEDMEKSRAAGMNAHLSKPIDPELMYGTLAHLISGKDE